MKLREQVKCKDGAENNIEYERYKQDISWG